MITVTERMRALVRERVEAQMEASIMVLRGDAGALDPTTGIVGGLANTRTIYSGKARIRTVSGSGVLSIGDGTIDTRSTVISIPITAPIAHRDDLVRVINGGPADANLSTRIFRVLEVEGGSLFGDARRMSCTGWYESSYWGQQ